MTAKNKAIELVEKYIIGDFNEFEYVWISDNGAKKCAIIAVDEIIEECYKRSGGDNNTWDRERINFWTEVKREIENL